MPRGNVVTGIDIGSSKIAAVIAEASEGRGVLVRGVGASPSTGVSKGVIRDINATATEVDKAFSSAVYSSGISPEDVFVNISGSALESFSGRASKKIENAECEVTEADVKDVLTLARPASMRNGYQVIHTITRDFILDGVERIKDPVGMSGARLEVVNHTVTGPMPQVQNIKKVIEKLDLRVAGVVHSIVADGEALLSDEEKTSGAIVIDLGAGTTDIGVFLDGSIAFSKTLSLGLCHVDLDLKQGLGVGLDEASRVKRSYGKAWVAPTREDLDEFIDIKRFGRREFEKIQKREVCEIIMPRIEEIAEHIYLALAESGLVDKVGGGIVLTGGGALMRELPSYLSAYLKRDVRVGVSEKLTHLMDEYRTPIYSTVLGLVSYGSQQQIERPEERRAPETFVDTLNAVGESIISSVSRLFGGKRQ
jgi:cell division protein FtsA